MWRKRFGMFFMCTALVFDVVFLIAERVSWARGMAVLAVAVVGGLVVVKLDDIVELIFTWSESGKVALRLKEDRDFVAAKAEEVREVERRIAETESSLRNAMKALVEYGFYSYALGGTKEQLFTVAMRRAGALMEIAKYAFTDIKERHDWIERLIKERDRLSTPPNEGKTDQNPN